MDSSAWGREGSGTSKQCVHVPHEGGVEEIGSDLVANKRTRRNSYKPKYSKCYSNINYFYTKGSLKELAESPFLEIFKLDCSCRLEH